MSKLKFSSTQPLSNSGNVWISNSSGDRGSTGDPLRPDLVAHTPWNSSMKRHFAFQTRLQQMEWEQVFQVPIATVVESKDFNSLESLFSLLCYSDITLAEVQKLKPEQTLHMFRLMQLEMEYLHGIRNHFLYEQPEKSKLSARRAMTTSGTNIYPQIPSTSNTGVSAEQVRDVVVKALQEYAPVSPNSNGNNNNSTMLLEKLTSDMTLLKTQLNDLSSVMTSDKFHRESLDKYEDERIRIAKALEVEERNRRLRVEQEIFNKERLINLEKERLERARMALELEKQQSDVSNNTMAVQLMAQQRELAKLIQDHMAMLGGKQPASQYNSQQLNTTMTVSHPQEDEPVSKPLAPPRPGTSASRPTDDYKLFLSCQNLPKSDWFSHSDPFIVVLTAPKTSIPQFGKSPTPGFSLHSITPVVWDTANPSWVHPIVIRWDPNDDLALHFQVWDADTKEPITIHNYMKQEFVGSCAVTLQSVCSKDKIGKLWGFTLLNQKEKPQKSGLLQIRCTSSLAEKAELALKQREEDDLKRREQAEQQRRENEEAQRLEEEERRKRELEELRRLKEEEDSKKRTKELLQQKVREKEAKQSDTQRALADHNALSQVYAERMSNMLAYQLRCAVKNISDPSLPSPFVALLTTEMLRGQNGIAAEPQKLVGLTEVQKNQTSAQFVRPLQLSCSKNEDSMLELQLYHDLSQGAADTHTYDKQLYLGSSTLNLQQLINSNGLPTTVAFSKQGKTTSSALTIELKRDEAECEAWKSRGAQLIREYAAKSLLFEEQIKDLEKEVATLRTTLGEFDK